MDEQHMIRVRLKFESTPVSYAKKCWFTFDGEKCRLVSDVSHLLASHFGIKNAHGIQLYMNEYLVPTNESAQVFRDNDVIEVRTVPRPLGSSTSSSSDEEESAVIPQSIPKQKKVQRKETENGSKKGPVGNFPPPPPPRAVKKLVGVTMKLATGGMHTKFHSSSSSSSSSSDSSSSDSSSDDQTAAARRRLVNAVPSWWKTQWDVKKAVSQAKAAGVTGSVKTTPVMAKKTALHKKGATPLGGKKGATPLGGKKGAMPLGGKKGATPLSGKKGVACSGGVRGTKEAIATAARIKKGKKGRGLKVNGKIPAVVGGLKDILTTNSCIYTSPVGEVANVKVTDATAAALWRGDGGKEEDHIEGADGGMDAQGDREEDHIEGADGGMDAQGGREEDMSTGEHVGPGGTGESAGEGGGVKAVECGDWSVRDYSGFPALQGVPRAGDRLAFKTLELSESYTPELSEFMEGTVISVDQGSVKVRYTDEMLSRLAHKAAMKSSGKFSLDVEDEDAESESVDDLNQEIDITVSDMVEPKLIPQ